MIFDKEVKKCKMRMKQENGKMKLEMRGNCDPNNADKIVNRDFEMEIPEE